MRKWSPTATRFVPNTRNVTVEEVYEPELDPVWPYMPKKDFMRIGAYIRNVANQFGLRDWYLSLAWSPITDEEDSDAMACITRTYGQRHATIRVMADFALLPPQQQSHALVHELLHLHLDDVEFLARETLQDSMGELAYGMYRSLLHAEIEKAVDNMALSMAELLPRIDEDWDKEPENADA
jgi:hypothetical protein